MRAVSGCLCPYWPFCPFTCSSLIPSLPLSLPLPSPCPPLLPLFPQAMKYIYDMKCKLAEMKDQEKAIRRGLNIFKIEQPPSNSIVNMEKVGAWEGGGERGRAASGG